MRRKLLRLVIVLNIFVAFALSGSNLTQTGSRWSKPIDISEGITENRRAFGTAVCDSYQNLHIFWADSNEDGAAIFYRNDVQEAWSQPQDILVVDDPTITYFKAAVSHTNDTVHLVWVSIANGAFYYSQASLLSAKDPRSWFPPERLATRVFNPDIAVDEEGVIHIVYAEPDAEEVFYTVRYLRSIDNGLNWSDPKTIYTYSFKYPGYIRVEIASGGKDHIYIGLTLRAQEYGTFSEVGLIRSIDGGKTWSDYRMVDNTSMTFQGVEWIAPYAFGEDEVHLTWHDPRRMHMWSHDGGETWSQPIEIMPLGGAFGGPNEIIAASNGKKYVVTAILNGVYSAEWNGINWGLPDEIDDRGIDPHGQTIVSCQGNQLHILYYDRIGATTVWYSSRNLFSPNIARIPLPTPTQSIQVDRSMADEAGSKLASATPPVDSLPKLEEENFPPYNLKYSPGKELMKSLSIAGAFIVVVFGMIILKKRVG